MKTFRSRLSVTALEDRSTPAFLQVVPYQGADGVTRFSSLATAVSHSNVDDVIQIEPGSAPGTGTVTIQQSVTIQGDPAYGGAAGLQAAGTVLSPLFIVTNNVRVVNLTASIVSIAPGASGTTVANCVIVGGTAAPAGGLPTASGGVYQYFSSAYYQAVVNSRSTVTGNTFISGPDATIRLGNTAGSNSDTANRDVVSNNVFVDPQIATVVTISNESELTVSGNRILSTGDNPFTQPSVPPPPALVVLTDCSGVVTNNTVRASGNYRTAVQIADSGSARAVDLTVSGNTLTATDVGVQVRRSSATNTFAVRLANNAMAGSVSTTFGRATAVQVYGNGGSGNGVYGTVQINGNDFRGYDGGYRVSIQVINPYAPNAGVIDATGNLYSVSDPQTTVELSGASGTTVNTANPQTGGAANLNAMFLTLGGGPPTTAQHSASDAATAAQQAQAAVRSSQAAGAVVDGLFVALLHRSATAGERTTFVNAVAGGTTLELVIAALLSAPEYYAEVTQGSANPDGAWVQSLYLNLLGRQGSGTEINSWIGGLRGGLSAGKIVTMFVQSAEFRGNQVRAYYGPGVSFVVRAPDILKRQTPPTAAEVGGWVNSTLDLLSIQIALLSSGEFQTSG